MFEEVSQIGKGTYGTVYRARLHETHEHVALKQIDLKSAREGVPCTALGEIAMLQNFRHENIVWLVIVYHNSKFMTLVFEYCKYDLRNYMIKHSNYISYEEVMSFSCQLLLGLSELHSRSVIHRDIKPQNLLINKQKVFEICDFGLARVMDVPHDELSLDVVTQWYRPPEILLRIPSYDLSVDIWSAGCVIVEMATSHPLFPGDSDHEQIAKMFGMSEMPCAEDWPVAVAAPRFPAEAEIMPSLGLRDLMARTEGIDRSCGEDGCRKFGTSTFGKGCAQPSGLCVNSTVNSDPGTCLSSNTSVSCQEFHPS
jgi:cyclin-dependent kinase